MVSVCLPSDALSQHLPSYLGFSYLEHGDIFMAAPPDLEHGVAPLGPPAPAQPLLLGRGVAPLSMKFSFFSCSLFLKKRKRAFCEVQFLFLD